MRYPARTTSERSRALDLLRSGATVPDVVAATGVPDGTVRSWARWAGVEHARIRAARPSRPAEVLIAAVARVAAGERVMPVARELGIDDCTLRRACRRARVRVARPGRPRSARAEAAAALARAEDITVAEAARRLGVDADTVYAAKYRAHDARRAAA